MKLASVFLILFLFSFISNAQNSDFWGSSLDLNSSFSLNSKFSLKPAIKSRITDQLSDESQDERRNDRRLDLQLAIERRLSSSIRVALGGFYRFGLNQDAIRFFQQIGKVHTINEKFNSAHRFKFDQTIREKSEEFRFRYRYSLAAPLKGYKINSNEKYFLTSMEYLAKIRSGDFSNEIRFKNSIGQLLKNGSKLEIGLDFRYDDPFAADENRLYLVNIAYFFNLN